MLRDIRNFLSNNVSTEPPDIIPSVWVRWNIHKLSRMNLRWIDSAPTPARRLNLTWERPKRKLVAHTVPSLLDARMTNRPASRLLALLAMTTLAACSSPEPTDAADGTWVGTITTEGNVTTVVNESGSVWGGTATLVEEASIGVELGPEEYMLGQITALYATDDEIYVLDNSASKVRVYDLEGNHLRSFGRKGQGPGELGRLAFEVAVGPDGRIFVGDLTNRRVSIYSPEGEALDEIPLSGGVACCGFRFVFAVGGGVWVRVRATDSDSAPVRTGARIHTIDGPIAQTLWPPELEYDRRVVRTASGEEYDRVPFAARLEWTLGHDESLIVGASDRYEFQVIDPDGHTTMVERTWDPTPVAADEADYWRRMTIANFGNRELSWNGENIPDHKPAYSSIIPSLSGELWLTRFGPASPADCALAPEEMVRELRRNLFLIIPECVSGVKSFDVFDSAGRFLGSVEDLPHFATPFMSGDTVVASAQDEAGTVMVKRYRLVLPGAR